jgi:hypothetical protein
MNKLTAIRLISENPYNLEDLIDYQHDKIVVSIAVSLKGYSLRFASEECKADKSIVLIAISNNGYAIRYASEELQLDREVKLIAESTNMINMLQYMYMEEINNNNLSSIYNILHRREAAIFNVCNDWQCLQYLPYEFQNDKLVVYAAISKNIYALQYASLECRNNKELIIAAVSSNRIAIIYASVELQLDSDILLIVNR